MEYPLAGLRVLDFSRVTGGTFRWKNAFQTLGAEVVKVEPPDGDVTRILGARDRQYHRLLPPAKCGQKKISVSDLRAPGARQSPG